MTYDVNKGKAPSAGIRIASFSVPNAKFGDTYLIREALTSDGRAIAECTARAFTTFIALGPPWDQDSATVPALLSLVPEPSGLAFNCVSRVAVAQPIEAFVTSSDVPPTNAALEGSAAAATDTLQAAVIQDPIPPASKGHPVMIGHALWTLCPMYASGRWILAAYLAPLSVCPSVQGQGVGGALMRDGLSQCRRLGVELLILVGHVDYYTRFGLLPAVFGRCALSVPFPASESVGGSESREDQVDTKYRYRLRPLAADDGPWLRVLWTRLCGEVDGAMDPGPGLLPWCSRVKGIRACVLLRGPTLAQKVSGRHIDACPKESTAGTVVCRDDTDALEETAEEDTDRFERVGYARFKTDSQANASNGILRFLAEDAESAFELCARIVKEVKWSRQSANQGTGQGEQQGRLVIPLPPSSSAVRCLFEGVFVEDVFAWESHSMAMTLGDPAHPHTQQLGEMLERIYKQDHPPLFVEWTPLLDE